jgi:hypothetical protein
MGGDCRADRSIYRHLAVGRVPAGDNHHLVRMSDGMHRLQQVVGDGFSRQVVQAVLRRDRNQFTGFRDDRTCCRLVFVGIQC